MTNPTEYRIPVADLWREWHEIQRKHPDDAAAAAELPGVARRLGLPEHEAFIDAMAKTLKYLSDSSANCPICSGGTFVLQLIPFGDIVSGAEELLKGVAASDAEKIVGALEHSDSVSEGASND